MRVSTQLIFVALISLIVSCGGGGGGSDSDTDNTTTSTSTPTPDSEPTTDNTSITVSGKAVDEAIANGDVAIYNMADALIGSGKTNADGEFSIVVEKSDIESGYQIFVSGGQMEGEDFAGELRALYRLSEDPSSANLTPITTLVSQLSAIEPSGSKIDKRDTVLEKLAELGAIQKSEWNHIEPVSISLDTLRNDIKRMGFNRLIGELAEDLRDGDVNAENMKYFPRAHGGIVSAVFDDKNVISVFSGEKTNHRIVTSVIASEALTYDIVEAPEWVSIDSDGVVTLDTPGPIAKGAVFPLTIAVANSDSMYGRVIDNQILVMESEIIAQGTMGADGGRITDEQSEVIVEVPSGGVLTDTAIAIVQGTSAEGNKVIQIVPQGELQKPFVVHLPDADAIDAGKNSQKMQPPHRANSTIVGIATALIESESQPGRECVNADKNSSIMHHCWKVKKGWFDKHRRLPPLREYRGLWKTSFVGDVTSQLWSSSSFHDIESGDPVLFVHGYTKASSGVGGGEGTWGNFQTLVKEKGYLPLEFQWKTNARFQDVAIDLGEAIELIHEKTQKKVHVIAHSFGGILVRTLLQNISITAKNVNALVASVTTVGTPHSGILDSIDTLGSTYFPKGQDSRLHEGCGQISCYQMGENVLILKDDMRSNYGLKSNPGEIARKLSGTEVNKLPNDIPMQILIGMTMNWLKTAVADGDGLISYDGQRFHPTLSVNKNGFTERQELLDWETSKERYGTRVVERILGANYNILPGTHIAIDEYAHSLVLKKKPTRDYDSYETYVECENSDSCQHDTWNRVISFIGKGETVPPLGDAEETASIPEPLFSDLVIRNLTVSSTDGEPKSTATVSFDIFNHGQGISAESRTNLRFNDDISGVQVADTLLGSLFVPSIEPGKNASFEMEVTLPSNISDGDYYIWVIADVYSSAGQNDESNDKANTVFSIKDTLDNSAESGSETSDTDLNGTDTAADSSDNSSYDETNSEESDESQTSSSSDGQQSNLTDIGTDTVQETGSIDNSTLTVNLQPLVAGGEHSCALKDDRVICWGNNQYGQTHSPTELNHPIALAAGWAHTCVLDDNGIDCWGLNDYGQTNVPAGLSNPVAMAAGRYHTCALDDNGVTCWGLASYELTDVPDALKNTIAIAAGWMHTCALDNNSGITCWGANTNGQVEVPTGLLNPRAISAGWEYTCALDDTGAVCWGLAAYEQTTAPDSLINPTVLSAGGNHTCAMEDADVICWGNNGNNQIDVPQSLSNPIAVAAGGYHTCAMDDKGITCWGLNDAGQADVPFVLKTSDTLLTNIEANRLLVSEYRQSSNSSKIYIVNINDGTAEFLTSAEYQLTDIAFDKDIYGVTYSDLVKIDPVAGITAKVGSIGFSSVNALVAFNGQLYAGTGNGEFLKIDKTTGQGELIGYYGTGQSSGDIAFDGSGKIYASVKTSVFGNDYLATVDFTTGRSEIIGDIGFEDVFGLGFSDQTLYGVTHRGELISIDTESGFGKKVHMLDSYNGGMSSQFDSHSTDNSVPAIQDQSITIEMNDEVTIFLSNTENSEQVSFWEIVSGPEHGMATLTGDQIVYKPHLDFYGKDQLTIRAIDDSGVASAPASIDLDIWQVQNTSLNMNGVLTGELSTSSSDGQAITGEIVSPPAHGESVIQDNTVTYRPEKDFYGPDSFTISFKNGDQSLVYTSVVYVDVRYTRETSQIQNDGPFDIILDDSFAIYQIVNEPEHGVVGIVDSVLSYIPQSGYVGTDSFVFEVIESDGTNYQVFVPISVDSAEKTTDEHSQSDTQPPLTATPQTIVTGDEHSCALVDEKVICWGDNRYGQTTVPAGLTHPMALAAGGDHTCALDDNGVTCWGASQTTKVPSGLVHPRALAAGWRHTCALDDNGVTCWGNSSDGQTEVPDGLSNPTAIAAGGNATCAIDDNGLICWGNTEELDVDVPAAISNPVAIAVGGDFGWSHACAIDDSGVVCWGFGGVPPNLVNPTAVTVGEAHACAIDESGVSCWGDNSRGQTDVPIGLSNPTEISAGGSHTCAIDDSGIRCWGSKTANPPVGQINAKVLVAGRAHFCFVDANGLGCWGSNSEGQIDVPAGLGRPMAIAVGLYHTCAMSDKGVSCWGGDAFTDVPDSLSNPVAIAAGAVHTCAMEDSGIACWGWGTDSHGTTDVPGELSNPVKISADAYYTCAIDDNGVVCWGKNDYGQLNVPADLSNPVALATSWSHACALDDNGVSCWGSNDYGQTAVPTDKISNPTAVVTGSLHSCALDENGVTCWGYWTNVPADLGKPEAIAAGNNHTCVIVDNGVRCWGSNHIGQLEVPENLVNPTAITAGANQTCVLDDNGVSCWGLGDFGQSDVPPELSDFDPDTAPSDLIIQNLTLTPTGGPAGTTVTVSFSLYNQGPGTAAANTTNIRFSTSSSDVSVNDSLLLSVDIPHIDSGARYNVSRHITIPKGSAMGTHHLWVITDVYSSAGQNDESNDKENTVFSIKDVLDNSAESALETSDTGLNGTDTAVDSSDNSSYDESNSEESDETQTPSSSDGQQSNLTDIGTDTVLDTEPVGNGVDGSSQPTDGANNIGEEHPTDESQGADMESTSVSTSALATPFENNFLKVDVAAIAVSTDKKRVTLSLIFKNTTEEDIFIALESGYFNCKAKIVDNYGALAPPQNTGNQVSVTGLPCIYGEPNYKNQQNYTRLSPGSETPIIVALSNESEIFSGNKFSASMELIKYESDEWNRFTVGIADIDSSIKIGSQDIRKFENDSLNVSVASIAVSNDKTRVTLTLILENKTNQDIFVAMESGYYNCQAQIVDNYGTLAPPRFPRNQVSVIGLPCIYGEPNYANKQNYTRLSAYSKTPVVIALTNKDEIFEGSLFSTSMSLLRYKDESWSKFPVGIANAGIIDDYSTNKIVPFENDLLKVTPSSITVSEDKHRTTFSLVLENRTDKELFVALESGYYNCQAQIVDNYGTLAPSRYTRNQVSVTGLPCIYGEPNYSNKQNYTNLSPYSKVPIVIAFENGDEVFAGSVFSASMSLIKLEDSGWSKFPVGISNVEIGSNESLLSNVDSVPIIQNKSIAIEVNEEVVISLSDTEGSDPVNFWEIVSDPEHGMAKLTGDQIVYKPHLDFYGKDQLIVRAIGYSGAASAPASIDLDIWQVQNTSLNMNGVLTGELSTSSSNGQAITGEIVSPPAHGESVIQDNTVTYRPEKDFYGPDSFTISFKNGDQSLIYTSVVYVDVRYTRETSQIQNDGPVDITLDDSSAIYQIVNEPEHGVAGIVDNILSYVPQSGYVGADSFVYEVIESDGTTYQVFVPLYVDDTNDRSTGFQEITIQPGPDTGKDTCWGTVYVDGVNQKCADLGELYIGGWGDYYYNYFEFELSSSPSADDVEKVLLKLYFYNNEKKDPAFQVYRVTESWTESELTRNNHPDGIFYKNFGASITTEGWYSVDITDLYKAWKNGTYSNYGIKLVPTQNNETNGFVASSDNSDASVRPKLVITKTASDQSGTYTQESSDTDMSRNLTVERIPMLSGTISGIAIESGGNTALVAERWGELSRIDLTTGKVLKSYHIGTSITSPAITDDGLSVLLITNTSGVGSGLVKVNLESGEIEYLFAGGIDRGHSLAIEQNGTSVLISGSEGGLTRVNLETKERSKISDRGKGCFAIESGGKTALMSSVGSYSKDIIRIDLVSGTYTTVATLPEKPYCIAMEPGEDTALVTTLRQSIYKKSQIYRVHLSSGTVSSLGECTNCFSPVVEPTLETALLIGEDSKALIRFNLSTLVKTVFAWSDAPVDLQIGLDNSSVYTVSRPGLIGGDISHILLDTGIVTRKASIGQPMRLAFNDEGTYAWVLSGVPTSPGISKIRIDTGISSQVASLAKPGWGIAIENSGDSALIVTKDEPYVNKGSIFRVSLASGESSLITDQLLGPVAVAIEKEGISALIVEIGLNYTGQLSRVNIATGSIEVIAADFGVSGVGNAPGAGIAIESNGETALIVSRKLLRVNLMTGAVTTLVSELCNYGPARNIILDNHGDTALIAHPDCGIIKIDGLLSTSSVQ